MSVFLAMDCGQSLKAIIVEKCGNEVGEKGMDIKDIWGETNVNLKMLLSM